MEKNILKFGEIKEDCGDCKKRKVGAIRGNVEDFGIENYTGK